jgi:DNA invertase Pin-like site-specific DNA recombinase
MLTQITESHRQKPAYVYLRQSSPGQVRHHQESTRLQYALRDRAQELGWSASAIRILDRDLGHSGAQAAGREDFKTLVAEVSMGQVGAVFALEVSRLARSNVDWHRLLELCAFTGTLVIDADGVYDPADFNDGLLLGLKGTMAQAELHFLRARLLGGKLNKAKRGELRRPLPVGFCYEDEGRIILDPDAEVRAAVGLVFALFRDRGSAYGVMQGFAERKLQFPKRAYGGAWAGQLVWGALTHSRVLGLLKNPCYAGVYVYGRYQYRREITPQGEVHCQVYAVARDAWRVSLPEHHPAYISWEVFVENEQRLQRNRTNGEGTVLSGPPREGLALLQGLLVCSRCGRRLTVRYRGNAGLYPQYECNWQRREARARKNCMNLRCDLLDAAISEQVLQALQPREVELAMEALKHLEVRDQAILHQWQMRLERAQYEAALAERRYKEVDPSNRLVAGTLEKRWNDALVQLEELRQQYAEVERKEARVATPEQKAKVLGLVRDFPRLWNAPSTAAKDRKRMLRLLIKEITVEKRLEPKQAILHIRWQGGACSDVVVDLPRPIADQRRYPNAIVEHVRTLAQRLPDAQIAEQMNRDGHRNTSGKLFTQKMIGWIRWRYQIPSAQLKRPDELTVRQVAERFAVSIGVVHYWIGRAVISARRLHPRAPYWITIDKTKEKELGAWVRDSKRIAQTKHS